MRRCSATVVTVLAVACLFCTFGRAEQHRATRLGNPATRFAPPIASPEEMRARFRDLRLRPDFEAVLREWGWSGRSEDMFRAAETAPVSEIAISVGTVLPFMSSRENGRAVCLRNVVWAGKEPAPAYAFDFTSNGRRYRCVTPKACSNFLVEDHGPEPVAILAMDCHAPAEVPAGQLVRVCLEIRNNGNAAEAKATAHLAIPRGALFKQATDGGRLTETEVRWELSGLLPNLRREVCATFVVDAPGEYRFVSIVGGTNKRLVESTCATQVIGITAILIDAVDLEDPVEVGREVTYEIKVTNQGSAPGTNVRLTCNLPEGEEFVSGGGASPVGLEGAVVTTEPVASLAPKAVAVWRVVVKAVRAGDARFKIQLTSDQFREPINEEESTKLY